MLAYFFGLKFLIPALLMYMLSFMFGQLTIEERGDHLSIRFGPLSTLRRSVRYSDILSFEAMESYGTGIRPTSHGWLWSVGGPDFVHITTRKCSFIVSTDDLSGLLEHLDAKLKARQLIQDNDSKKI